MQDRFFIDTNLLIYYISNDESRKEVVKDLLVSNANIIISSQVIAEFVAHMRLHTWGRTFEIQLTEWEIW